MMKLSNKNVTREFIGLFRKQLLVVLAITLAFLSVQHLYFKDGFPYTHDGENHLARFANYKVAVKEGQFPPRFAPNLMNHYGYPVFNYNYPLANIASLPFSALDLNYQLTFKLLAASSFIFGLVGLVLTLKRLNVTSPFAQSIAVLIAGTSPFVGSMFYHRGNIGEIMAWSLLPWLLYTHTKVKKIRQEFFSFELIFTSLIWSLFFLSHNVTVLFGTPLVILYAISNIESKNWLLQKSTAVVLGILISLWFWLPALAEKSAIVLDGADVSLGFTTHFPTFSQLLSSSFSFGFSRAGTIDDISLGIGSATIAAILIAILAIIKSLVRPDALKQHMFRDTHFFVLTLSSLLLITFQLKITQPIWEVVLFARFIQFPWRLTLFLTITSGLLAGLLAERSRRVSILLAILAFFQMVTMIKAKPVDYFSKQQIDYDLFAQSTSTNNENLPKTFTYQEFSASWEPKPSTVSGQATFSVSSWTGTKRSYQTAISKPTTIVEPTMNFLGWETQFTNLDTNATQKVRYVNSEQVAGRIAYQLEPGDYDVSTKFTQNTPARLIGNTVSLLSIGLILIASIYRGVRVISSK